MNQVAGPFAPQQPGAYGSFGFDAAFPYQPASYHSGGHPTPSTQAASQAFAQVPAGGYYNNNGGNQPPGGNMRMMQAFAGQQHPYTTAPYPPPVPAQAPPPQLPQPQQAYRQSQSASPQQRLSPNAHPSSQVPQQTPPNIYPMAAPPLPQSPANQQPAAGQTASPTAGTPQSPGSQSREQQRVALLLDINLEMLQEVNKLQAEGKGGAINPQQQAQLKAQGQSSDLASDDYIQVMRRVQANLGYLMPRAQNDVQKQPKGPAFMSPPPHMPQLQPKYDQLRELFPDWPGLEHRVSQSAASPGSNGMNGMMSQNATASPAPA